MTDIKQWKVILIDDEPDSLQLVHEILTLHGAEVYEAANGKQGLALLEHLEPLVPTLFIIDLAMPRPDGWDLLTQIRANPALAAVPVVAITAYYSESVIQRANQVGFNALFPKPIKSEPFLNTLKAVVG